MIDAQNWLNVNIPKHQKQNIETLIICLASQWNDISYKVQIWCQPCYVLNDEECLTGNLDLSDFVNLKEVIIRHQKISHLTLTNCIKLEQIIADDNMITWADLPHQAPKLARIHLTNNNLRPRNLSCFSRYPQLKILFLGTDNPLNIFYGVYNRWNGSLIHLKNLKELEELDINATDVSKGLEHLPTDNLFHFTFGCKERTNARVGELIDILAEFDFNEDKAVDESSNGSESKISQIEQWKSQQKQQQAQIIVID